VSLTSPDLPDLNVGRGSCRRRLVLRRDVRSRPADTAVAP